MTGKGYAGTILHVDLSTGNVHKEELDQEFARTFIGGFGINNRLAYDHIKPGVEPLSPENAIIIGTGVLAGTIAPCSTKVMVTTKMPSGGTVSTAFGGSMADMLKYAGYDHVIITGKADRPSYLKIIDNDVQICDASELWGKDIHETTDRLKAIHGAKTNVMAIGPSGENLTKFSFALVNKFAHIGRGGLGAVMGAKNLKAVAVLGSNGIGVADQSTFDRVADEVLDKLMKISYRDDWMHYGPAIARVRRGGRTGPLGPGDPFGVEEYLKLWRSTLACPSCPVGCKFLVEIPDDKGGSRHLAMSMPFSAADAFGTRYKMENMAQAIATQHYCDGLGLDDGVLNALMEFVIELYQEEEISPSDVDGLELQKDSATCMALLGKIARREGIGDVLADGFETAIEKLGGHTAKYANVIKGLQAMGDPRMHFHGMSISQVVNPRGSYVVPGNSPAFVPGRSADDLRNYLHRFYLSEEALDRICETPPGVNMGRFTRYTEDWYATNSSLGICVRQPVMQIYNLAYDVQLYNAATGANLSPEELYTGGERAWTALKAVNMREGFDRKDDKFPERFFEPLVIGDRTLPLKDYFGNPLDKDAVDGLFDAYYDERGWDVETGVPTKEKLTSLGMGDIAADLETRGKFK